uniref:Uncharacterized protein n=1 Tax=Eutreptiella gymnastica TaxID=73025 RepID=A0A7S1NUZ4_9EUGL
MYPHRIRLQLEAALGHPNALVGSNVVRIPENSTHRYTDWANSLTEEQLYLDRFKEVTLLMPTWFIKKDDFLASGMFQEQPCEDLLFLYAHVSRGGKLFKVPEPLTVYRYHEQALTQRKSGFGAIPRKLLLKHRTAAFEKQVLPGWGRFSIWSCGRDGKEFFKNTCPETQQKVVCFADVDPAKVGKDYFHVPLQLRVPIVHVMEVVPPVIILVASNRDNGFQEKFAQWRAKWPDAQEGVDYWHFC